MAETLTKIFISGYPYETDEVGLAQLVSPYGQISTVKIVRDKVSRKPKGYAFIEMATREAAENAVIALNGVEMQDKTLTVNIVEETPVPPASTYKKVKHSTGPEKRKRPRLPK